MTDLQPAVDAQIAVGHNPPPAAIAIVIAVGTVAVLLARASGRSRGRRQRGNPPRGHYSSVPLEPLPPDRLARTPRAFFSAIRRKPGNALWLASSASFLAATWADRGFEAAAITLLVIVLGFPFGYLWWRRWGPP
jgi:hypothetical protein